ncbi:dihydrofolate reductase family protein [Antarctobacter heliothermus]|uniref:Dihydrofolate reductase n=1 Tax=Antarctobacter heliothermus TaxID=74033 RepID=A0A239FMB4_9RHOB|nr:dihydrofolate reductase family protein [Antarctobacter heliothermus]SNS57967.1 Dihydrofolate reductase [Antarctobacter heliothermus]
MHPIVYDVAVSVDGFISGPDGDISNFAQDGQVVEDYRARLAGYSVAIMGRKTYEFGYRFGMTPGQNPYSHMRTIVFSKSLDLPEESEVEVRRTCDLAVLKTLKTTSDGPVYLCGGGDFAGALVSMGAIDLLRLKRAPILLGGGVTLFGQTAVSAPPHPYSVRYLPLWLCAARVRAVGSGPLIPANGPQKKNAAAIPCGGVSHVSTIGRNQALAASAALARRATSSSATRNASSSDCEAFRRGSQAVW